MNNSSKTVLFEQTVAAWVAASKQLGFQISAPYKLCCGDISVDCLAFIPDFGGREGMVIGASRTTDSAMEKKLIECAKERKLFWSFINMAAYNRYDFERFKEALDDWGYFGPVEKCPRWFGGYNHTQVEITYSELVSAWKLASISLGFKLVLDFPPFTGRYTFVAYLPDFGSRNGIILAAQYPPRFDKDRSIQEFAKAECKVCLFLDASNYTEYDEKKWRETLASLGYFGPSNERPSWLP
ncbi:MAG TPA: hypothetical protein VGJ73_06775 [Verrucomicrobiae bacterium]|jgi:hypothetical protein